jgi:uncharacterized protein Usg
MIKLVVKGDSQTVAAILATLPDIVSICQTFSNNQYLVITQSPPTINYLLQQSGDFILQQNGSKIILR